MSKPGVSVQWSAAWQVVAAIGIGLAACDVVVGGIAMMAIVVHDMIRDWERNDVG